MANDIRVKVTGDASDLIRELDRVEDAADDVADAGRRTGDSLGTLGDKADVGEQRIMGLRDTVDGLAAVMEGPGEQGISSYLQGWADLASGVTNFVVPTLKTVGKQMLTTAGTAVKTAATHALSAAKVVAGWVAMGVQSLLAAAKVAAAWLISMGPIALVIAAVIGLVVLIVKNWDTIKEITAKLWEWVKDVFQKAVDFILNLIKNWSLPGLIIKHWDTIVAAARAAWDWIQGKVKAVADWIVNLIKNWSLPGLIIKHWDTIKEAGGAAWDWIQSKVQAVIDWFKSVPGKIGSATAGMWDGIKDAFRGALNWIIDRWNGLSFTLPSFSVFGQTIGGITISTPNIPRFHTGGVFRAPTAGGEGLALLRDRETILPPGARPGGITVIVNGYVGSELGLAEELDRLLTRRSRTTGLGFV